MAIICQSNSVTIGSSDVIICGIPFKIHDIEPTSLETIDVITGYEIFQVAMGINTYIRDNHYWIFKLISKNVSANTAVINFTNSDNPCYNIICPDICVGNDLYTQYCNIITDSNKIPNGYDCRPDTLKTPNYPDCMTTGSIACSSTPYDAQIWLDENNTNQVTPYTLTNISTGSHKVTYKLTGYNDCDVNVTVTAGGTVSADCTLVTSGQEITDMEIYYKVPWIYPKLYVNAGLYLFKQEFDKDLVKYGYPNYKVHDTFYNEYTHIITVKIKKMYSLSSLNNQPNTLIPPFLVIPLYYAVLAISGALLAYGLINLWILGMEILGAEDVTVGVVASNRIITVRVYKVDESGNYVTLNVNSRVEFDDVSTDGSSIIINNTILANVGYVDITLKEKFTPILRVTSLNLVHELSQSNLTVNEKGNQVIDVYFTGTTTPVQDLNAGATKTNGNPVTCGNYIARYAISGSLISEGALKTDGTIATVKTIPGKKAYIIIVPCDLTKDKMTYYEFTTSSEPMNLDIFVKSCDEAKNALSIILQRKKLSGVYEYPLPDSVHIIHPSGKILDLVSGTDYTPGVDVSIEHDEFEKGTHTVKIVRSDSTININTKTITFDTDCFTSQQLIFDAEPTINTADVIIKVVRSDTKATVQGVYVYVDTDIKGYLGQQLMTNNVGIVNINGVSYAKHTFTLKGAGFKDITHELIIDASTTGIQSLEIDSNLQVGNVDTSIINLISIPSGDLIPNTDVKFEGDLVFTNQDGSYDKLGLSSINIKIKDGLTTVKEYNVKTDQKLSLSPGKFRTPTWTLPKSLAKKDLDVTASFDGSGDYKSSSETQIFHVTEGCCLTLPLIGCVASQSTCNNIKIGAYIIGGLAVGYVGYKAYKSVSSKK